MNGILVNVAVAQLVQAARALQDYARARQRADLLAEKQRLAEGRRKIQDDLAEMAALIAESAARLAHVLGELSAIDLGQGVTT